MVVARRIPGDQAEFLGTFERGAFRQRIDRAAVDPLPRRRIGRHGRNAVGLAAFDLAVVDEGGLEALEAAEAKL